jgi:hypothetical protein
MKIHSVGRMQSSIVLKQVVQRDLLGRLTFKCKFGRKSVAALPRKVDCIPLENYLSPPSKKKPVVAHVSTLTALLSCLMFVLSSSLSPITS